MKAIRLPEELLQAVIDGDKTRMSVPVREPVSSGWSYLDSDWRVERILPLDSGSVVEFHESEKRYREQILQQCTVKLRWSKGDKVQIAGLCWIHGAVMTSTTGPMPEKITPFEVEIVDVSVMRLFETTRAQAAQEGICWLARSGWNDLHEDINVIQGHHWPEENFIRYFAYKRKKDRRLYDPFIESYEFKVVR